MRADHVKGGLVRVGVQAPQHTLVLVSGREGGLDGAVQLVREDNRSPAARRLWANCCAERFVRTVRSESTDRMLALNRRHLDAVLDEHVRHYNGRRPHRSREFRPPRPDCAVANFNFQRFKDTGFWEA